MARFVRGDIVLLPFPFSGDQDYKHRPALVLASWDYAGGTDYLVCLITTQPTNDPYRMDLSQADTLGGSLKQKCYLRPTYLFAPDERVISRKIDHMKPEKLERIVQTIVAVLTE